MPSRAFRASQDSQQEAEVAAKRTAAVEAMSLHQCQESHWRSGDAGVKELQLSTCSAAVSMLRLLFQADIAVYKIKTN